MRSILTCVLLALLMSSCGEKGGKKRKIDFKSSQQERQETGETGVRIGSTQFEKLALQIEGLGLVGESKFSIKERRYLREKILTLGLSQYRDTVSKVDPIDMKDEFRFFAGELVIENKKEFRDQSSILNDELGRLSLRTQISFEGLGESQKIENLTLGISSYSKKDHRPTFIGQSFAWDKKGEPIIFKNNIRREVETNFLDVPKQILHEVFDVNSMLFVEVLDADFDGQKFFSFHKKERKNRTRIIISLPGKEIMYLADNGKSLMEFLKSIDSSLEINHSGNIVKLMDHEQDHFSTYLDRDLLDNVKKYNDKKIWFSNIKEKLNSYRLKGETIFLAYSSLAELRSSSFIWEPLEAQVDQGLDLKQTDSFMLMGEIEKTSIRFDFKEFTKEIAYEVGSELCLEDGRFERKRSDCQIAWKAAKHYPVGIFREAVVHTEIKSQLKYGEIYLEKEKLNRYFKVSSTGVLSVSKEQGPKIVQGGFIGWESYDEALYNFLVRAPYDDLSTTQIKYGTENNFTFKGWKLIYFY